MSTAVRLQSHAFSEKEGLLFDANVWLFIYGPGAESTDKRTQIYSDALKRVLAAKAVLYSNTIVLSEFVNRWARMEFKIFGGTDFKAFRKSSNFPPVARAISIAANQIAGMCASGGFSWSSIGQVINDYGKGTDDFNDLVIAQICREKKLKLVTDDGDFRGTDIPVLTANNRLL